jgi:hypothetical protein
MGVIVELDQVGTRVLVRGEPGRIAGPTRRVGVSHCAHVVLDRDPFGRLDLVSNVVISSDATRSDGRCAIDTGDVCHR